MGSKHVDLTGLIFGRLTVLERAGSDKRHAMWLCRCECGEMCSRTTSAMRQGRSLSCGCLRRENGKKWIVAARSRKRTTGNTFWPLPGEVLVKAANADKYKYYPVQEKTVTAAEAKKLTADINRVKAEREKYATQVKELKKQLDTFRMDNMRLQVKLRQAGKMEVAA